MCFSLEVETLDKVQFFEYNTEDKTTYDTEEKTTTRGHNQLDYARVLKEMYESKKINLYDVIINDVADVICEMLYYFNG